MAACVARGTARRAISKSAAGHIQLYTRVDLYNPPIWTETGLVSGGQPGAQKSVSGGGVTATWSPK